MTDIKAGLQALVARWGMDIFRSTMRRILLAAVIALMPLAAIAQDFDKGLAAYEAGDYATAFKEWRPLAEQGHAGAQFNLGVMYEMGEGVPQNYAEAIRLYLLAAEQGLAKAQDKLDEQEVRRGMFAWDSPEGARLFRMGAKQGSVDMQQILGIMYAGGDGVPKDLVLAYMWLDVAATNGRSFSGEYRDKIAERMKPEQIAEAQRRAKVCLESNYKDCD